MVERPIKALEHENPPVSARNGRRAITPGRFLFLLAR
jgi:hypothetical protein